MAPDEIEAPRVRCFRLTIYARKWCQSTPIYWYQLHCCLGFLFITTQLLLRYTQIQVYRALLSAHSSLVLIFVIDVSKTEMVTLVLHWDKKKYISLNRLFVFQLSWYRIWRYLIIYILTIYLSETSSGRYHFQTYQILYFKWFMLLINFYKYSVQINHPLFKI